MNFESITFTTYSELKEQMDAFLIEYGSPKIYMPPNPPIPKRIPRKQRVCRYCEQGIDKAKFNTDPHIIPNLLGVNYGVSDFECDECNNHFARLETNFADYLGLMRTITSVGRHKVPKFTSPRETLIATVLNQSNKDTLSISDENGENFIFDKETNSWQIRYVKNSYTPIKVYQILLKIALGVLPNEEAINYRAIREFIREDKHIDYFKPFAKVFQCTTTFYVEKPYAIIFKKLNSETKRPTHIFYLRFENLSYQLILPFHPNETEIYKLNDNINLLFTPPLLFTDKMQDGNCRSELLDFTCPVKVVGELGHVGFSIDEKLFTHSYNPKTKEFKEEAFKPEGIKKIYLSKSDQGINLEHLEKMAGS